MMTLQHILTQLELPQLSLVTAEDSNGNKTDWMRHWDNDRRIAVSIPKELAVELQANPGIDSLGIQKETRTSEASQKEYLSVRIVKYTPAEITLRAA